MRRGGVSHRTSISLGLYDRTINCTVVQHMLETPGRRLQTTVLGTIGLAAFLASITLGGWFADPALAR